MMESRSCNCTRIGCNKQTFVKSLSAAAKTDMNFSQYKEILVHVLECIILNNIQFIHVGLYSTTVFMKILTYTCPKIIRSSVLHAYKTRRISEKNL